MRSACLTIALNGYEGEYADCIATQREYSRRHGYGFVAVTRVPWRMTPRQSAWLKVELIRRLLLSGVDYVAFIDADCEVRQHTPSFETAFEEHATLMLAPGKSGRLNSGVIFAKRDREVIEFLSKLVSISDEPVPKADATAYENGHFIHHSRGLGFIGNLDHHLWNNNSHFDPSSYIQHYSNGVLRSYRRKQHDRRSSPPRPKWLAILDALAKKDTSQLPTADFLDLAGNWFSARSTLRPGI